MSKIETIIFDWSGVLLDELEADVATVNEILQERGYPAVSKERFQELYELPWGKFYTKQGIRFDAKQEYDFWKRIFPKHYSKCALFPGAKEVLETFKKNGKKVIVLSSHSQDLLKEEIKQFGLAELIDAVDASNNDKRHKVEEFLKQNGVSRREAVFVGDTAHDIETARYAGIKSIAALWGGLEKKEKVQAQKPNYSIEKISELPALIGKIECDGTERTLTKKIDGKTAHVVAVALIECGEKFVLLERSFPAKGVALITGHVCNGETEQETLEREVLEETGGKILEKNFAGKLVRDYGWKCTRGESLHEWRIYKVKIDKLRKKEIDEGKLLLVPFNEIGKQGLFSIAKEALKKAGYLKKGD